jgi:hypothetical protein
MGHRVLSASGVTLESPVVLALVGRESPVLGGSLVVTGHREHVNSRKHHKRA